MALVLYMYLVFDFCYHLKVLELLFFRRYFVLSLLETVHETTKEYKNVKCKRQTDRVAAKFIILAVSQLNH